MSECRPGGVATAPPPPPSPRRRAPARARRRYASSKLRFGAFDVCLWPGAAAELRLSSNTWSNVLPSCILFDKAKEWGRLPPPEAAGDPRQGNAYTGRDIVRLFKLEERFSRALAVGGAASGGGSGGSGKASSGKGA